MTGPISVDGAVPGGAVAITIHEVEVVTPGVVVFGSYEAADPYAWWDDESGCDLYPVDGGTIRFDEHTSLPTQPLVGCLAVAPEEGPHHAMLQGRYGGNMDCRDLRAGATLVLPVSQAGGGLYFGDCKALMGDGEIVGPPEVGALVTASAEPRERPAAMSWPRIETAGSLMTLVSGRPLEWSAREAFRELLGWVSEEYALPRVKAALLLGMVARTGICQISNTDYTASCTVARDVLGAPRYGRCTTACLPHEAPAGDRDHALDNAVLHSEQPFVEVHAAAGMVRHDPQAIAERQPVGDTRDVDVAVLLVDRVQSRLGQLEMTPCPPSSWESEVSVFEPASMTTCPGTESEITVTCTQSAHASSPPSRGR